MQNKNMKIVHLIHTCDNIFIEEKVNCGPPELSLKMRVDGHHNVRNLHLLGLDEPAYNWFALWSRTAQVKCFDLSVYFLTKLFSWCFHLNCCTPQEIVQNVQNWQQKRETNSWHCNYDECHESIAIPLPKVVVKTIPCSQLTPEKDYIKEKRKEGVEDVYEDDGVGFPGWNIFIVFLFWIFSLFSQLVPPQNRFPPLTQFEEVWFGKLRLRSPRAIAKVHQTPRSSLVFLSSDSKKTRMRNMWEVNVPSQQQGLQQQSWNTL